MTSRLPQNGASSNFSPPILSACLLPISILLRYAFASKFTNDLDRAPNNPTKSANSIEVRRFLSHSALQGQCNSLLPGCPMRIFLLDKNLAFPSESVPLIGAYLSYAKLDCVKFCPEIREKFASSLSIAKLQVGSA